MKAIIEDYIILPVAILGLIFISPTVVIGGLTLSVYLAGHLPDTGICKKDKGQ
jgi:hypothetical protein